MLRRALRAHFATTLNPNSSGPLAKAFRKLKLSHKDPLYWRFLALQLAEQRFKGRSHDKKIDAKIQRYGMWLLDEAVIRNLATKKGGKWP
jgi:hypothetical protein